MTIAPAWLYVGCLLAAINGAVLLTLAEHRLTLAEHRHNAARATTSHLTEFGWWNPQYCDLAVGCNGDAYLRDRWQGHTVRDLMGRRI